MAYKLERAITENIDLEVGSETLHIAIGGVKMYRSVLESQAKLKDVQTKIEVLSKAGKEVTPELVNFLGETVLYLFEVAFGKENAEKILAFYEGNYDEMLMKVYPFFKNIFIPALKNNAKAESKELAEKLAYDS